MGRLIKSSITENTREVNSNGINCFDPFRELWSRSRLATTLAALLSHVAIFISYLSLSKISHNTVSAYLSAITFPCKIAHHEGFANNLLVSKMLEGMRRVHKTVDTCLPIYDTLLGCIIKILPFICISDFEATLFASAFSLSFHGF